MKIKKDFKYKLIDNFLNDQEVSLLSKYCILRHKNNHSDFDVIQGKMGDTSYYNDPLMCSIMENKINLMEKETGIKVLPTYAFWRMYTYASDLKKHKDRPSCEVSVTVMIDSDGTSWPIYVDGKAFDLKKGQALIYLGCDVEHWREEFQGDWHAQTFLHYVDAEGRYKDFKYDKKFFLGQTSDGI